MNNLKNKYVFRNNEKKITIQAIPVKHGRIKSICYIVDNKLAYASDVSLISKKNFKLFKNLKYFIIDCLWYKEHYSHFNLDQVLNLVKLFKPKKTILTNMHSDLDYCKLKNKLPKNVFPGYDGMTIAL